MSGYITAVPVTDNQHVAAGDVIARIDDRDYRTALEQAEAQVAAAQASIENIDAQIDVQQAQIDARPGAGRAGAGQPRVRAAAGGALRASGADRLRHASRTPQQYTSQLRQQQAALKSAAGGAASRRSGRSMR